MPITSEILAAAEILDPLVQEPAAELDKRWHGIWADPGMSTPTGWTHVEGNEFSTARWWRYGFPSPAFVGVTFAIGLDVSQEFKFILMDDKVGNNVELKIAYNTTEQYFWALINEDDIGTENVLALGFVPRKNGDQFYLSVEEGANGVKAWRKTGEGVPTSFGQGTLVTPLASLGKIADIMLFHSGTFRATNFTAGSLDPEPPIEEETAKSTLVALNYSNWGSEANVDVANAVNIVRYDAELGTGALTKLKALGLTIHILFPGPYDEGGVSALDPDEWVEDALAFYEANLTPEEAPIVEVLNEPGGQWFWGEEANSAANSLAYRVLIQKTYEAFHAVYGLASPKIIGSVEGNGLQFGEQWWTPECAEFVDGVVIHPYGGTGEKADSALGNRARAEEARELTGQLVYLTEVGWPTALTEEQTPDSLQWTEEEQAANIKNFFTWARSTEYVSEVVIFTYHDFGTTTWYGVVRLDGSHKPAYAVMQEQSEIYAEEAIIAPSATSIQGIIEITDEFTQPNGEWTNYDVIANTQVEALHTQKHVNIRSFVADKPAAAVTLFFMDRLTMFYLDGTTATAWSAGVEYHPGEIIEKSEIKYLSIKAGTNKSPPNAEYWNIVETGGELAKFSHDASPPAHVVVVNNEAWTFGTVGPQSDRNNWNGISMTCKANVETITQSVMTQSG